MRRKGFTIFLTQAEEAAGWGDDIAALRRARQFSRIVKEGIRLVSDLMNGRTDVLLEMFPFVVDAICPKAEPPDTNDMERRIADAVANRLKGELQQQGRGIPDTRDYGIPAMKQSGAGVGSTLGKGKLLTLPSFDDDEMDTIVLAKSAATMSNGANLMAGIFGLEH